MKLISTTLTLFFKIFIPTFWLAFFGILILSLLFYISPEIPIFRSLPFIFGSVLFYALGFLVMLFFFMRLKRVEVDDTHIYVSNYFKTYRYTHESVLQIDEESVFIFKKIRLHLSQSGSFGSKIVFLSTKKRWQEAQKHPLFYKDRSEYTN